MTMQPDWTYYVEFFDSAIHPEQANSSEEVDAVHCYRRLLTDPEYRHALCLLLAVGPGGQAVQAEIERLYAEETQAPA